MKTIKPEDYVRMKDKAPRIRSSFTYALANLSKNDYLFISYDEWTKSVKPIYLIRKYIKNPNSPLYKMKFWCDDKEKGWVIGKKI